MTTRHLPRRLAALEQKLNPETHIVRVVWADEERSDGGEDEVVIRLTWDEDTPPEIEPPLPASGMSNDA